MKTAVVLTIAVLANSLGNICLSKGMKAYGVGKPLGFVWLLETGSHVVSDGWLILGIVFLLIFLSAYMTALSWADLSFVLPSTAPAYLLTASLAKVFLHEAIPTTRWAGTILIAIGAGLVSRTSPSSSHAVPQQDAANPEHVRTLRETPANSGSGIADRSAP